MKSSPERVGQRDPGVRFSPKRYSSFRRHLTKQRVLFAHGEQDYINLGKLEGAFLRVTFHWWRLKVLGTPHLHGEASRKVEPVVSPRFMGVPQVVLGSGSPDKVERKKTCWEKESSVLHRAQGSCLDVVD